MRQKSYEEENEIDLLDFIFMIIRRWKVIMLIIIPIVALGFFLQ